jgi:hypothetical protein
MACMSLEFIKQLIIWAIVVGAIIAVIQLLIPWLGTITWPWVAQVVRIILWAIVAIAVVTIIFALLQCLVGGGLSFPRIK